LPAHEYHTVSLNVERFRQEKRGVNHLRGYPCRGPVIVSLACADQGRHQHARVKTNHPIG
jgi:hypothetical protein